MLTDVTDGCKHTLWCPPEEQKERERERGRERELLVLLRREQLYLKPCYPLADDTGPEGP